MSHKFMGQVEAIFSALPRKKEWRNQRIIASEYDKEFYKGVGMKTSTGLQTNATDWCKQLECRPVLDVIHLRIGVNKELLPKSTTRFIIPEVKSPVLVFILQPMTGANSLAHRPVPDDVVIGVINSANNVRRELLKSQKAMAYAVLFPVAEVGSNQHGEGCSENTAKPSNTMLYRCRKVLQFCPEKQTDVLNG